MTVDSTAELRPHTWPALDLLEQWLDVHQPVTDGVIRGRVIGYGTSPPGPHSVQVLVRQEPRRVVWLLLDSVRPLGRNLLEDRPCTS